MAKSSLALKPCATIQLWTAIAISVLAAIPTLLVGGEAIMIVRSAEQLYTALADSSVTQILVNNSLLLNNFFSNPLRIGRSITLEGFNSSNASAYPLLDFNFASNKQLLLAAGVTLTLRRLAVTNIQSRSTLAFDFFAPSEPGSLIVWEGVVDRRALCPPLQVLRDTWAAAPRPAGGTTVVSDNSTATSDSSSDSSSSVGSQQEQQALSVSEEVLCYGWAGGRCYSPVLRGADVRLDSPAGYRIQWNNTVTVCDEVIPQDCIDRLGVDLCFLTSMEALLAERRAQAGNGGGSGSGGSGGGGMNSGAQAGVIAGCVAAGVLLVLLLAALLLGRRRKRHCRYSPTNGSGNDPSAGAAADPEAPGGRAGGPPPPPRLPTDSGSFAAGAAAGSESTHGSLIRADWRSAVFRLKKAQSQQAARRVGQLAGAGTTLSGDFSAAVLAVAGGGGGDGFGASPVPAGAAGTGTATGTMSAIASLSSGLESNGGGAARSLPAGVGELVMSSNPVFSGIHMQPTEQGAHPAAGGGGGLHSVGSVLLALLRSMVSRSSNPGTSATELASRQGVGGVGGSTISSFATRIASATPMLASQTLGARTDGGGGGGGAAASARGTGTGVASGPGGSVETAGAAAGLPHRASPLDQKVSAGLVSTVGSRPSLCEIQQELNRLEGELMRDPRAVRHLRSPRSRDLSTSSREGRRERERERQPPPTTPARGAARPPGGEPVSWGEDG